MHAPKTASNKCNTKNIRFFADLSLKGTIFGPSVKGLFSCFNPRNNLLQFYQGFHETHCIIGGGGAIFYEGEVEVAERKLSNVLQWTTLNIRSRTVCLSGSNYVFVYYLYKIYLLPLNSCSLPRWSVGPQWKWRLLNANCPTFSRGPPNIRGLTVFSFASTKSTENMQYCTQSDKWSDAVVPADRTWTVRVLLTYATVLDLRNTHDASNKYNKSNCN